ncbi:hypothetical protein JCM10369A_08370 [Nocardioides pyridinolyticus]
MSFRDVDDERVDHGAATRTATRTARHDAYLGERPPVPEQQRQLLTHSQPRPSTASASGEAEASGDLGQAAQRPSAVDDRCRDDGADHPGRNSTAAAAWAR